MYKLASIARRCEIIGEFFGFLWREKLWWMIPMFGVIFIVGLLIVLGQSSAISPFIYTLF